MKIIYFSKTIAAYDLKVGRCIEQNDLMNLSIKGQGHYLIFAKGHSVFKIFVFSKTVELFETKYHVNDFGSTEMKIYTNGLGHMTKIAAMPMYGKNPSKIFFSRTRGPIAMKLGL